MRKRISAAYVEHLARFYYLSITLVFVRARKCSTAALSATSPFMGHQKKRIRDKEVVAHRMVVALALSFSLLFSWPSG